jgi:hypothetical protein
METPERNNKPAERVSAGSRVDGMILAAAKLRFAAVLKAELLADIPSSFRDPTFFDEVPLYSRYAQIDFLKEYGDVDQLLLELSLEYLQRVESELALSKSKRFMAITVVRDDANETIVPSIFVCNSKARVRLKGLHLLPPSKGLGEYIKILMQKIGRVQDYDILEDRATVPDDVRVFISSKTPPHGMVGLEGFTNGATVK